MKRHKQYADRRRVKETFLELNNVSKNFLVKDREHNVIKDISFKTNSGEILCILGPSGCGKTTLLDLVAGFTKPSTGKILINEKEVDKPGSDRCVVFQKAALFPWLSVKENIAVGLKILKVDKKTIDKKVDNYLQLVGLDGFGDYLIEEISGGMAQRVALARVLVLNPPILLMDEPFSGLDFRIRNDMQNLLLSVWAQFKKTIIFITHDIDESIILADRIILMDNQPGQIIKELKNPLIRPRDISNNDFIKFKKEIYLSFKSI